MSSAKAILAFLILLFALAQANAQAAGTDQGGQQPPQQVSAPGGQPTSASEEAQAVPAGSVDGAMPSSVADAQNEKPISVKSARATVIFDQRYTQLRRGHDQEIAVLLCPAEPGDCWFMDTTLKHQLVPLSLQMDHAEGFTIRYGAPRHYDSKAQGTPSYRGDRRLIFLKVHASENVSLGEHVLKGTMVFRRAGSDSGELERLAIEIKVAVADESASVIELDWPYIHHPGRAAGDVASNVGWAVLLVPLLPVLGLACLITVHSLDCH